MKVSDRRPAAAEDFLKCNAFGPEALIFQPVEKYVGSEVATANVVDRLKKTRNLVEKESFRNRFSEQDCELLVTRLFGHTPTLNVKHALETLRTAATSPETKLLLRSLALYCFDQLSPAQTKNVDLEQLYADLHVTEREIAPIPRRSGASKFTIYRLSLDGKEQTRLHIYPAPVQGSITEDSRLHEHFGDSCSIILAGQVLNRHHQVSVSQSSTGNGLALYKVKTTSATNGTISRIFQRVGYFTGSSISSSHVYSPGDYYQLPGSLNPEFLESLPYPVPPELRETYHTVANQELSATLFAQRVMAHHDDCLTVLPEEGRGEGFSTPAERWVLDPEECFELLLQADEKIRRSLSGIHTVNCEHLARQLDAAIEHATAPSH